MITKHDNETREWQPDTDSPAHHSIARTVINRINFPKREARRMTRGQCLTSKQRALLTRADCSEVWQTVALVLIRADAFYAPLKSDGRVDVPFSVWKAVFVAAREVILREKNTRAAHEESGILSSCDGDDDRTIAPLAALPDPEDLARFRARVAGKARAALNLARAAHRSDKSRKRNANKRRALRSLRYVLGAMTGNGLCLADTFTDDGARRRAMFDLRLYLSAGVAALRPQDSGKPLPEVLKSFAQLR